MERLSIEEKKGVFINEDINRREVKLFASPKSKIKRDFAIGMTIIKPGKVHEPHEHDKNQEIVVVYEGKGIASIGEKTFAIEKGDLISIEYNETHCFENNSNENLKLLWIYSPSGLADEKFIIED